MSDRNYAAEYRDEQQRRDQVRENVREMEARAMPANNEPTEAVEAKLRSKDCVPGTLVHRLLRYAEIHEEMETRTHGRPATNSWAEGFRDAVNEILALRCPTPTGVPAGRLVREIGEALLTAQANTIRLAEALRPFAREIGAQWDDTDPMPAFMGSDHFTVGDFRHAHRILAALSASNTPASGLADEDIARLFHDTYERLAPSFGYETRDDTKQFDPESPNGRLMVAVCGEVTRSLRSTPAPDALREALEVAKREIQQLGCDPDDIDLALARINRAALRNEGSQDA